METTMTLGRVLREVGRNLVLCGFRAVEVGILALTLCWMTASWLRQDHKQ
jgi:hypothetical protein